MTDLGLDPPDEFRSWGGRDGRLLRSLTTQNGNRFSSDMLGNGRVHKMTTFSGPFRDISGPGRSIYLAPVMCGGGGGQNLTSFWKPEFSNIELPSCVNAVLPTEFSHDSSLGCILSKVPPESTNFDGALPEEIPKFQTVWSSWVVGIDDDKCMVTPFKSTTVSFTPELDERPMKTNIRVYGSTATGGPPDMSGTAYYDPDRWLDGECEDGTRLIFMKSHLAYEMERSNGAEQEATGQTGVHEALSPESQGEDQGRLVDLSRLGASDSEEEGSSCRDVHYVYTVIRLDPL